MPREKHILSIFVVFVDPTLYFKESDCVFSYPGHNTVSSRFPVTMNDKTFLFNVQATHCLEICEKILLWDIQKWNHDREQSRAQSFG